MKDVLIRESRMIDPIDSPLLFIPPKQPQRKNRPAEFTHRQGKSQSFLSPDSVHDKMKRDIKYHLPNKRVQYKIIVILLIATAFFQIK